MTKGATCHPDRLSYGRGLCKNCYERKRRSEGRGPRATCHSDRPHRGRGLCRTCWDRDYSKRRKRNPEKTAVVARKYGLRKKYGLTLTQYETLLKFQGGACAICRKGDGDRRLAVDHDHATGVIRGLLCGRCNLGIGYLQHDASILAEAQRYVGKLGVVVEERCGEYRKAVG